MKLYTGHGTNPRVIDLFLAQKNIELERVWVEISTGENRQENFLAKNALGQLPVLELDNGQVISQITAICEYLEELYPQPPLIGLSAEERAQTRMWVRRIDLNFIEPLVAGYRSSEGLTFFQLRVHCIPQAATDLKDIAAENLVWLNKQLEGKSYICGERFTLADIVLFCFMDFANHYGQPVSPHNHKLMKYFTAVSEHLSIT